MTLTHKSRLLYFSTNDYPGKFSLILFTVWRQKGQKNWFFFKKTEIPQLIWALTASEKLYSVSRLGLTKTEVPNDSSTNHAESYFLQRQRRLSARKKAEEESMNSEYKKAGDALNWCFRGIMKNQQKVESCSCGFIKKTTSFKGFVSYFTSTVCKVQTTFHHIN